MKSICWLNATTSELCLLFTNLRALRTTGEGWEGGIYASAYFRIRIWLGNPGDRTLPLDQLSLHFVHRPHKHTSRSFVSNLPPTPSSSYRGLKRKEAVRRTLQIKVLDTSHSDDNRYFTLCVNRIRKIVKDTFWSEVEKYVISSCHQHRTRNDLACFKCMWLSGTASERGIRRSEVRFLMKTQKVFYLLRALYNTKTSFSASYIFGNETKSLNESEVRKWEG